MTYPTPTPALRTVGANIVALLQAIPYLQPGNGGTCKYAASKDELLAFSTMATPFAVVVPSGEAVMGNTPTAAIGGAVFETEMRWELYLGSASFSIDGEAFGGTAVGSDPGIDAMIDDAIAACLGKLVSAPGAQPSKLFPSSPLHRRYDLTQSAVVWQLNWRNQWERIGV